MIHGYPPMYIPSPTFCMAWALPHYSFPFNNSFLELSTKERKKEEEKNIYITVHLFVVDFIRC